MVELGEHKTSLREARRNVGLTQKSLASLLGIDQACISRWESGKEEIPKKKHGALRDILFNKRGTLDPLIESMVKKDPSLAIMSSDTNTIVREGANILNAFRLNRSDVDGFQLEKTFEAKWKQASDLPFGFFTMTYERDVGLRNHCAGHPAFRIKIHMISLEMMHYDRIILRKNQIIQPKTAKSELNYIKMTEVKMPDDIFASSLKK